MLATTVAKTGNTRSSTGKVGSFSTLKLIKLYKNYTVARQLKYVGRQINNAEEICVIILDRTNLKNKGSGFKILV